MTAAQKIFDGKKGSQIVLGSYSPEKVSANYNGSKVNKITGELYPEVRALKCVEQQVSTGTSYQNHQVVKDRNSSDAWIQKQADLQQKIAAGEATARGPAITQWIIPNIIGINAAGNKVLTYWPNLQNRPRVKYYISVDGEAYRECTKEEIAQYKSPVDAQNFLTPYADKQADKIEAIKNDIANHRALIANMLNKPTGESLEEDIEDESDILSLLDNIIDGCDMLLADA